MAKSKETGLEKLKSGPKVPSVPPGDAREHLEKIIEVQWKIDDKRQELEQLHRDRDALYRDAITAGATIADVARAAGVSVPGVKYMLGQQRKRDRK